MPLVDKSSNDLVRKAEENAVFIRMYDPPRDGKTPADGAGTPATSEIRLGDRETKAAQGFSLDPVGWDGEWSTLGDFPVRPGTPFVPVQTGAIITGQASRTREMKR